jgi:hypothetical protein
VLGSQFCPYIALVCLRGYKLNPTIVKNVYALFGYDSTDLSSPYVQLMPLTDPMDAHDDWVTTSWGSLSGGYGGGLSSQGSSMSLTGSMPAASSDVSALDSLGNANPNSNVENNNKNSVLCCMFLLPRVFLTLCVQVNLLAIIGVAVLCGLLLTGIAILWFVRRRRRGSDGKGSYNTVHEVEGAAASSVHVPLYNATAYEELPEELPILSYKD